MRTPIPAADKVPVPQKVAFSYGYGLDYLMTGLTTGVLWLPFFNIGLGMSPAVLGSILMLLRIWDAFTDPMMGIVSDNTRTRWGRRRPYILVGGLLTTLVYVGLWWLPPQFAPENRALVLTVLGFAFFTFFTIWSVPFYSLQLELTPHYDERTRLAGWVSVTGKLVVLIGGWVMAFATSSLFADEATGRPNVVKGIQYSSLIIALLAASMCVASALVVRERYYESVSSKTAKVGILRSVRESSTCGPLWQLIAIMFCMMTGMAINNTLGQYAAIYYLFDGDLAAASVLNGWRSTGVMIVGIAGIPLWTWLSERFDKKRIVTVMLSATCAGHLMNLLFLTPERPYLWLVSSIFESGAIGAVFLFLPSMKADVADYDELKTGSRREGSLNAFFSWFVKIAMTLGAGLGAFSLQLSGFDAKLPAQDPEVIERIKWLYISLPFVIWMFTLPAIRFYPLDRANMAVTRAELERRRGTA